MKNLAPNETRLTGEWLFINGKMIGDENTSRIEWLLKNVLEEVRCSPVSGGWETLFLDPTDGRYWEHTYPQSYLHGGGPPELIHLSLVEAKQKYKI